MAIQEKRYTAAVFNFVGKQNDEFLVEITDPQAIKKNQVYFALMVNGLPGNPGFGVGISEGVGEMNGYYLRRMLERRIGKTLPGLVQNITLQKFVIEQDPGNQYIAVDLWFTDLDSNQEILIPVGFRMNN